MARIASAGIIIKDGQILLNHRVNHGKQYFSFPGGGQEPGETLEQTAEREIKEEASVIAKATRPVYHIMWDNGNENWYYLADHVEGVPTLSPDSEEFEIHKGGINLYHPQWVPIKNLSTMLVYPLEIRDLLIKDVAEGFKTDTKTLELKFAEKRETI